LDTEEQTCEKEIDPQRIKKLGITYKFVQKGLGIPKGLFETILETMISYKLPYHKKKMVKKYNLTTIAIILGI
jgi:late competence protein required for DNA uptake (superfamily II DNA/RNA helicase)